MYIGSDGPSRVINHTNHIDPLAKKTDNNIYKSLTGLYKHTHNTRTAHTP